MPHPIVNPGLLLTPAEDGYIAYYPGKDIFHTLNPTASLLVELCDGTRSTDDIRQLVTPILPPGTAHEIDAWFDSAFKSEILLWEGDTSHREFTPQELFAIVTKLKDNGQIKAAYYCAKRVVERAPENWDAWYEYGDLCQYVGKRQDARDAFQRWFNVHPEDAEIEHLLYALRDAAPPARASDRTIQQIYKDFAGSYEARMLEDLGYKGPERLQDSIRSVMGDVKDLNVLDIGCGSGLSGVALKPLARRLTGIDLSPEMLQIAAKRNIYDALEVAEITAWLKNSKERFDIIAALDCLIYFGDLTEVVTASKAKLNPRGIMFLSCESGKKYPFTITDTGRYEHHPDHVRDVANAAGLEIALLKQEFIRKEYGSPVIGVIAVLRK